MSAEIRTPIGCLVVVFVDFVMPVFSAHLGKDMQRLVYTREQKSRFESDEGSICHKCLIVSIEYDLDTVLPIQSNLKSTWMEANGPRRKNSRIPGSV